MTNTYTPGQKKWLHEGLTLLGKLGADAITIDGLCNKLNLSKGSFYHHFKDRETFLRHLTLFWEKAMTEYVIETVEMEKGNYVQKLQKLGELTSSTKFQPIEREMRHWATQNQFTKSTWERVEKHRLAYTEKLLIEAKSENPQLKARALHAIFVGSQYLCPPASSKEIFKMYRQIIPLNMNKHK